LGRTVYGFRAIMLAQLFSHGAALPPAISISPKHGTHTSAPTSFQQDKQVGGAGPAPGND
jgi:hypothetical protein